MSDVTITVDCMESIELRVALRAAIEDLEVRQEDVRVWAREAAAESNSAEYKLWATASNNCKASADILKRVHDAVEAQLWNA